MPLARRLLAPLTGRERELAAEHARLKCAPLVKPTSAATLSIVW